MKLELTWSGKEKAMDISSIPMRTFKDGKVVGTGADGVLIHGDNLDALRALLPMCRGKVKCVFIDPPYNTGHAFTQYDDALEHSKWLSMMAPRMILLRQLLSEDGSIWITLDDSEAHYAKALADEIFGRQNFLANIAWEKTLSPRADAKTISTRFDHLLVYAKNHTKFAFNREKITEVPAKFKDVDANGTPYYLKGFQKGGSGSRRIDRPKMYYPITAPDGSAVYPQKLSSGEDGRWRWGKETYDLRKDEIMWKQTKKGWSPNLPVKFEEKNTFSIPETLWFAKDVDTNTIAKEEIKALFPKENPFDTPKPERLLKRIIHLATNPGDLVLDSFLGSATTCAVAHKMGRKWVGIEMGDHFNQCVERLKKVVDGEPGGISADVNWQGGGGFNVRTLGKAMIDEDGYANEDVTLEQLGELNFVRSGGKLEKIAMQLPFVGINEAGEAVYCVAHADEGWAKTLTKKGPKVIYCDTHDIDHDVLLRHDIATRELYEAAYV